MNTGERVIEWLYEKQLQVDDEWAVPVEGGFKWWPGPFAQTVRIVDFEVNLAGDVGYILSCETEVLTSLTSLNIGPDSSLAEYMCAPSMCGPVYDASNKSLTLASQTRVHDEIESWIATVFSVACMLQVSEAFLLRRTLAEELSAMEAVSAHPLSGTRSDYDQLAPDVERMILQGGQDPVCWTEADFAAAVADYIRAPEIEAVSDGLEINIWFPYGPMTSHCQFVADDPHPKYGNGLLVAEAYPYLAESEEEGLQLALLFNAANLARSDQTSRIEGYGFGSYFYRQGRMFFSSFYPNVICKPNLLFNVFPATVSRAYDMAAWMFGEE